MCGARHAETMVKIHVFLGAPSSSPPGLGEAVEECSSCVTSGWAHVDLSWQVRRLHPAPDYVGHQMSPVNETILSLEEHSHLLSFETDGSDMCSVSILEYLDSCYPQTELKQIRTSTPLSYHTEYLSTWTLSQALVLRGAAAATSPVHCSTYSTNHRTSPQACSSSRTSPKVFSTSRTSPQTCSTSRTSPQACASYSISTPELFSSAHLTSSPVALHTDSPYYSAELFNLPGPTTRAEKDSVVLQATVEGLLCSQGEERDETPCRKKLCLSDNFRIKLSNVNNLGSGEVCLTTPLAQCAKLGVYYSILVAVVHPCHLKEIRMKSGTYIPLASIIVTDQSGVEMKVVLWRRAAFWALVVSPGDILFISELQVNEDTWRGERVLRSTYNSKLLNRGRLPLSAPQPDRAGTLSTLCEFLRKRHSLLVSLPAPPVQMLSCLPYSNIRSLRVNTLVHMLLRVAHTHMSKEWQSEADSRCRSALQQRVVLSVEQPGGQQARLVLWGAAMDWLPRITRDPKAVWDCHVLLVREGVTSDLPEVHTTPWSSVLPLDLRDPRSRDFVQPLRAAESSIVELDLRTLLSQKYSGEVELRVQVEAFHFNSSLFCGLRLIPDSTPLSPVPSPPVDSTPLSPAPGSLMDSSSTVRDVLKLLSGDVTYTGCGHCGAELDTDSNGIYSPCYPCLPHTAVRCYYRLSVLRLSDRSDHQLCVQVPPVVLQNILRAPPDKLCKTSAPGSRVRHIQLAAERLHSLLALPKTTYTVTVQSHFLCDQNSVPLSQEFTLLSLQFPP